MHGFRHIFITVALLVAAMPCCHAHSVEAHVHEGSDSSEICATHICDCHSCEEVPCTDDFEMPQESTTGSIAVPQAPVAVRLIVFTAFNPVVRQVPPTVPGTLARIRTIQLLI